VAGALVAGLGVLSAAPATAAPVQPTTATSTPASTTTSTSVTTEADIDPVEDYVSAVYLDLLGRDIDPVGLAGWSQALRDGVPRVAVANGITSSDEFRSGLITEAYGWILEREVDAVGSVDWLVAMRNGLTIQQLEAGILASDEYAALYTDGSLDAWLQALYAHVLGRDAADEELDGWLAAIDASGASKASVALGFLNSTEALTPRVDAYYQGLLGRGIDPTGAREWVLAIQSGVRLELIVGGIIASDEYYAL
jgi:hypothetical protein